MVKVRLSVVKTRDLWCGSLVAVVLAAAVLAGVVPVRGEVRFEHLTNRDGLSQVSVNAVLQDRRGYLWFGTADGLNRYDGYGFRIFKHDVRDRDSLSNAWILTLYEDRSGDLWIGTQSGLNRFDPVHERFISFHHEPENPNSLSHDIVQAIHEDPSGTLWVGTLSGLNQFSGQPGLEVFTRYRHDPSDPRSLSHDTVHAICGDAAGTLWIGTEGGLSHFDPAVNSFTHYRHEPEDPNSLSHDVVRSLYQDSSGVLWIGTHGGGLNRFDRHQATFTRFRHDPDDPRSLSYDKVRAITQDRSGALWVATHGGGLNRFDRSQEVFTHYRHDPGDPHSLGYDSVLSLFEDRLGILWAGTIGGGLSYHNPLKEGLAYHRHHPNNPASLSYNTVFAIHEDRSGVLWIGTDTGGLNRRRPSGEGFLHYRHDPQDPDSLSHDEVRAIHEDRSGTLWIGTHGGGLNRFDPATERFTHYRHDPEDSHSLSYNEVLAITEDRAGHLWVGTEGGGLNRFDPRSESARRYRYVPGDPASLSHDEIWALLEDRSGSLWIGTGGGGLNRFNASEGRFVRFRHDPDKPESLSHDFVWTLFEDRSGNLWIGTGGGLNYWDPLAGGFVPYTEADGLSNNVVYGILEDDQGRLWLSTNAGLTRFDPGTNEFVTYDVGDGLQDNEFNWEALHRGSDGTLYFGGVRGFNAFMPEGLRDNPYVPPVVLTSFKIFEHEAELVRAASFLEEVELGYREDSFSFEFAALNFIRPDQNEYAYMLEGLDEDWVMAGRRRYASYTNVPPGDYEFRVRGSNNDGVWNEEGTSLRIAVAYPPWKTWWAYLAYALAALVLIGGYLRSHKKTIRQERAIAQRQRVISRRLREVDRIKDEFLANTSHELRTPLYGITGLAESLADGARGELPELVRTDLAMIAASGQRLSALVGDLIDFSQLRHKGLELRRRPVDLRSFAEVVLTLSRPLRGSKALRLVNAVPADLPPADADESRLQQILLNLVGNAVKFTEAGSVKVDAEVDGARLVVRVSDTGIGIAPENRDRIFDAFEQADGSTARAFGGTGLGLAITRQLVELHGGRLWVDSIPNRGSTFHFTVPISTEESVQESNESIPSRLPAIVPPATLDPAGEASAPPAPSGGDGRATARILIVDDEPVVRQVLVNHLSSQGYQPVQAPSGPEALRLLKESPPDLVLLDVMMPKMSGYEVCRRIREQYSVEELPVIILTAKNQVSDLAVGFSARANDYLVKPIAKSELLARVASHLDLLEMHRNLERLVEQRTAQVKVLRGLLPICAGCKKIRDDEGFWNQLEIYIDAHSEAQFSHALCPDCAERAYGELGIEVKENSRAS